MIKRVNFTGRKRIARDRVQIEVFDGQPRTFSAAINLAENGLLPHAAVFLEAMCAGSTVVERFECGTVENLQPICNRELHEIEGENVFFALKVVDRTEEFGRILGIAENIRPERSGKQTASGRRGILPIDRKDLDEEIWQLEWREHDVYLLVNDKIPGLVDRAQTDPLFYSLVYPEVVRRVLAKAIEDNAEIDEDDDRWSVLWLRFGKNLHPDRSDPPKKEDTDEDKKDWIDDAVKTFCEEHAMKSRYLTALTSAIGGES